MITAFASHSCSLAGCGHCGADHHLVLCPNYGVQFNLCRIRYGNRVRVTSPALEDIYHLQIVLSGSCLWRYGNASRTLAPGDVLIINPDDVVDLVYSDDCEKFVVKLPRQLMRDIAADPHSILERKTPRFHAQVARLGKMPGLTELLRLICHEANTPSTSDNVRIHYARAVAAKLLETLPHRGEANNPLQAPFKQLVEFIDAHPEGPIDIDTLARCANVSRRALYTLFKRHTGESPMVFVRRRRLERARDQLRAAVGETDTVTAIALTHGFTHLSRFAAEYRRAFGERPSQTLFTTPS
ncbi:AraC family transcriptional regulator [Salinisphaera orenii]|uniref:AraC family transcriptional regulator n=1 Tax=Salinisphaera orenii TaxID=856731 RepID=UPI000F495EE0|nr:AraC family transcriptional regulator [Salinisphaera halophila]